MPPNSGYEVPTLQDCPDPVAALLAAHRAGGLVSLRTSGTTGRPREVIRTASSWVDSFPVVAQLIGLEGGSRVWVPGPLSATMNLYAAALATYLGASLVDSVSRASHAFLTPTGLIQLLAEPAPQDLRVIIAGDRLGIGLADRAAARGWRINHYYGAAQLSFVAWGRDEASLRPFPEVAVEARTDGRLWVSSPWLCEQVIAPEEAPSAFQVEIEAGTGRRWATVGDRGRLAVDGRVVVLGRDDVILTGGATVLVGDVEAVLRPAARGEVCLVPQPHDRLGSVVVAVCTDIEDLGRLAGHARTSLAGPFRPRRWLHRPELPLTAAGKVDRTALTRWVAQPRGDSGHPSEVADDRLGSV
ncbi:MAG TPA: o-succinylbenzoate--CoA ligase [Propionibacteriaceae bacterium]|nr:o-succinylbenzoate--CoA ligase [Propionibacteriaceae bacterium]